MTKLRFVWFLLAVGLCLGLLPSQGTQADSDTVTVHLQPKRADDLPPVRNTGDLMPTLAALPATPATFAVYDVTTAFNTLNATQSLEDAATTLSRNWAVQPADAPIGEATTDDQGVATFATLPVKTGSIYRVYLFAQISGATDLMWATPTIFAVPTDAKRQASYTLYPKASGLTNTLQLPDRPLPALGSVLSLPGGQPLQGRLRFTLPATLAAEMGNSTLAPTQLHLQLTSTSGLALAYDQLTLTADDQRLPGDWAQWVQASAHRLTLLVSPQTTPEAFAALAAHAGQPVTLAYTAHVQAGATPFADQSTTATLTVTQAEATRTLETSSNAIETGATHVVLTDAFTHQPLSGASFLLHRADGTLAQQTETGFTWVTDAAQAAVLPVTADGLTLTDLAAGDYTLEEVAAPLGHEITQAHTPFTIAPGAIGTGPVLTTTITHAPDTGLLPATGSIAAGLLLLLGLSASGSGLLRVWRRRQA
ncbi:SpaA isopeptide-forming pilin-related protein [Lacticaseibacillus daqingensis]|uniref:SpaA isopeptide-forming pilin-related protein n=1 Tax=Lacticaseibacillus daqingensis TaxID=2486014 RepID=UPI000F7A4AD0|nr:SpaA isopeptide-forming pilin-related protein [Lacticaseibacillus daqingensis]